MGVSTLILVVLALAAAGYIAGRMKAKAMERAGAKPHSRSGFHAAHVMNWVLLPSLAVIVLIVIARPIIVDNAVRAEFPAELRQDETQSNLIAGMVSQIAGGLTLLDEGEREQVRVGLVPLRPLLAEKGVALGGADIEPFMVRAAETLNGLNSTFSGAMWLLTILAAVIGGALGWLQIKPEMRARNRVETVIKGVLIAASAIAILTTVGIVFSMLSESLRFFSMVSPVNFFFGSTWDPRFAAADSTGDEGGQYGILPLLWGTAYISIIALIIAVPIGLFSAIYMAEYASKRVRGIVKPIIEVLAGIPTIVYGFFALVTVGPIIRDAVAVPLGLGSSGSSVMTAGVVMGIMIIPFISSLSDDIINAVPQSLRDGSYGLGATKSETVRQVVLPAALPGIVGAVLLAASRAIGETMIVVLAAGVATRISLNPFQEMTTITVKIVSQLTGDTEFTSPQVLVAFALGLTLFVVTLGLNIYALHIVRKYREQYD
ncbi:MAG: phosphate ABC transporter permease subunit PstC [Pikeienuella sp.]|uniref:phosphate ABC transporter permease subunit PstC n=1 Tax=Pikeienuella sp. TaxID=2831957 RepID=UPI00391BD9FD